MFGRRKEAWKPGIPKYKESDLLEGQELLNFVMNAVKQFELDANGYKILAATDQLGQIPNFVCEKNGKKIFIIVKAAIAPDMPVMSVEEKKHALEHASKFGAECFFAPVGIGSHDSERFEASLALKNDGFYFNYQGLQKIEFKKSADWIKNALAEIEKLDPSSQVVKEPGVLYSSQVDPKEKKPEVRYSERDTGVRYSLKVDDDFGAWKKQVKTETFQEMLMKCIQMKGMTNQEFYTAALIDRKLFSAIKNNPDYQPKKETAVACCLGLNLCWQDAEKLLELAGYKLSLSISWDRVIYYCLHHGITDIDVVNEILYEEGDKCIRV